MFLAPSKHSILNQYQNIDQEKYCLLNISNKLLSFDNLNLYDDFSDILTYQKTKRNRKNTKTILFDNFFIENNYISYNDTPRLAPQVNNYNTCTTNTNINTNLSPEKDATLPHSKKEYQRKDHFRKTRTRITISQKTLKERLLEGITHFLGFKITKKLDKYLNATFTLEKEAKKTYKRYIFFPKTLSIKEVELKKIIEEHKFGLGYYTNAGIPHCATNGLDFTYISKDVRKKQTINYKLLNKFLELFSRKSCYNTPIAVAIDNQQYVDSLQNKTIALCKSTKAVYDITKRTNMYVINLHSTSREETVKQLKEIRSKIPPNKRHLLFIYSNATLYKNDKTKKKTTKESYICYAENKRARIISAETEIPIAIKAPNTLPKGTTSQDYINETIKYETIKTDKKEYAIRFNECKNTIEEWFKPLIRYSKKIKEKAQKIISSFFKSTLSKYIKTEEQNFQNTNWTITRVQQKL